MISRKQFYENIKGKKCIVVGDVILDQYIYGDVNRISPEAPIPVVHITGKRYTPGGAANVASTVAACGADTVLCGCIGWDQEADEILGFLEKRGIRFCGIRSEARGTITKVRVTGQVQQMIRLDYENPAPFDESEEREVLTGFLREFDSADMVIISDYGKGICSEKVCRSVIETANQRGIPVLVDPKRADWSRYAGASIITPNFKEFSEAVGKAVENAEHAIAGEGIKLIKQYSLKGLLVTRSQYGMTYLTKEGAETYSAKAQEVFDVSGAGDTVISVLAAFLMAGLEEREAVKISNSAAAVSVSKIGTYVVSADEVFDWQEAEDDIGKNVVTTFDELAVQLRKWRKNNAKIVFTNQCR